MLFRSGKKNPNEVPWGREREEPSSLCGEERDRAPVDTVPSSLEQGKDTALQSQLWFRMCHCTATPLLFIVTHSCGGKGQAGCGRRETKLLAIRPVNACLTAAGSLAFRFRHVLVQQRLLAVKLWPEMSRLSSFVN